MSRPRPNLWNTIDPVTKGLHSKGYRTGTVKEVASDFLAALSFAGLFLAPTALELVHEGAERAHYFSILEGERYVAAGANMFLSALALVLMKRAAWPRLDSRSRTVAVLLLPLALLLPATRLWRREHFTLVEDGFQWLTALLPFIEEGVLLGWGLAFTATLFLSRLAYRAPIRFRSGVRTTLLILSPFAVLSLGQIAWVGLGGGGRADLRDFDRLGPPSEAEGAGIRDNGEGRRGPPGTDEGHRVVFILFDELDAELLQEGLSDPVPLEGFENLVEEGVVVPQAPEPSRWTVESVPALTLGLPLDGTLPLGHSRLGVLLEGSGEEHHWNPGETFLGRWHAEGGTVAIAGWYHPYCRVFRDHADACRWMPWRQSTPGDGPGRWLGLLAQQWSGSLPIARERSTRREVARIEDAALRWVGHPDVDLLWIHHPMPHEPWIGPHFTFPDGERPAGYRRNLQAADRFLGQVKDELRRTGLDEQTALFVTSDHSKRSVNSDTDWIPQDPARNVPVLIRLPGEAPEGRSWERPCPPFFLGDLALSVLRGEVATNSAAQAWIRTRGSTYCPETC